MPYLLFLRKRQNWNCRLLQIIGGALWVNISFSGDICCLLLSSVKKLDPDDAGQNVGPDLDTSV